MKRGEVIVFKFFFKYTTYICHHRDEKKNDLISTDELANLDHDNKDDEEDKVSVEVGVAVPLLLLVETHLDKCLSLRIMISWWKILIWRIGTSKI